MSPSQSPLVPAVGAAEPGSSTCRDPEGQCADRNPKVQMGEVPGPGQGAGGPGTFLPLYPRLPLSRLHLLSPCLLQGKRAERERMCGILGKKLKSPLKAHSPCTPRRALSTKHCPQCVASFPPGQQADVGHGGP